MSKQIEQCMQEAVDRGVFPAASLLVGNETGVLFHQFFGQARVGTCFDIASVTKAVSTATLAMQLVAEDLLHLNDPLVQWIKQAKQNFHKTATVAQLLSHRAGFPSWQAFYRELPLDRVGTEAGYGLLIDACLSEPKFYEPGSQCIYSDLGYIVLGEVLAQAGLAPLDVLFQHRVANPLNLKNIFFVRNMGSPIHATKARGFASAGQHIPTGTPANENLVGASTRRFAPTEDCPWRERIIHGEVHDPNAYAMGGVAGHAGLFSTAEDLHRFATELVKCYRGTSDWIPQKTVQQFLDFPHTPGTFVLGWDTPSPDDSSAGHHFSPESIGHLGYTGCSLWIDLKKGVWAILLTNRIHPDATNEKIRTFRPQIHDLIAQTYFRTL